MRVVWALMDSDLHALPPGVPRRRWLIISLVAALVAVSFGALFYSYSVLLTDKAAGAEFSASLLSFAYTGFVLVGGAVAFVVGRMADRSGVRPVFALGATAAVVGLLALSVVRQPWQVVAVSWLLFGPAGAMTFYEPAFVAVDQWFGEHERGRAIGILTVIGGLAAPVFLPLTGVLVSAVGWRPTARILALIVAAFGIVVASVVPSGARQVRVTTRGASAARNALSESRFVLYTAATLLLYGGMQAIFLHRIAVFEDAGIAVAAIAIWAGAAGLASLPGRYAAPLLAPRLGPERMQAVLTFGIAASVLIMLTATSQPGMVAHFLLFGVAFGGLLPLRAVIMGQWYSGAGYGRVMGLQWTIASMAGAAIPWLVGLGRDASGAYTIPLAAVGAGFVVAGFLMLTMSRSVAG